ncbi:MAG: nitroreductase family deazaflavin-dependent oxidoreductase [Candidatus Nanopelagicales bacterium]|nr:nitroreductase family deazaflavin-dependent oxidoreductase [Candidatus Nanopelagicales bacterium]
MPLQGEYEPSPVAFVRDQVALIESSGGLEGIHDPEGRGVIVLTTLGAKSGKIRKSALMRVEHDGAYVVVASQGGSRKNPVWYFNVQANPLVELQDGPERHDYLARELAGDERAQWWERAVADFPPYGEYQKRTERVIPVFILERVK